MWEVRSWKTVNKSNKNERAQIIDRATSYLGLNCYRNFSNLVAHRRIAVWILAKLGRWSGKHTTSKSRFAIGCCANHPEPSTSCVDVKTCDANGMIVIPQCRGGLIVGVVIHRATSSRTTSRICTFVVCSFRGVSRRDVVSSWKPPGFGIACVARRGNWK